MKMNICDVCRKEGKIVEAVSTSTIKQGATKLVVDTCEPHKGVFKGIKDFDAAYKIYTDILKY